MLIRGSNHHVTLNLLKEKKLFIVNLFLNINQFSLRTKFFYHFSFLDKLFLVTVWRKLNEYLKIKLDFRVRKMTRAASQAGDAESSRTPGLNSSVQTSMNDHGVRYYIVFVPQWECISYSVFYIIAVKSYQERMNLNETQRRNFKYELQFKI